MLADVSIGHEINIDIRQLNWNWILVTRRRNLNLTKYQCLKTLCTCWIHSGLFADRLQTWQLDTVASVWLLEQMWPILFFLTSDSVPKQNLLVCATHTFTSISLFLLPPPPRPFSPRRVLSIKQPAADIIREITYLPADIFQMYHRLIAHHCERSTKTISKPDTLTSDF